MHFIDIFPRTQLRQEAVVNVYGIPLCSKMESLMTDSISKNAGKVIPFTLISDLTDDI